jgi:cobalt/nickel transport system permease protein
LLSRDEASRSARIARVNPKSKLLFGFCATLTPLIADHAALSFLMILIVGTVTFYSTGLRVSAYLKLLALPLGFLAMAVLPLMLQAHAEGTSLIIGWSMLGRIIGITPGAFADGLGIALGSLAAVSGMYFILLTTPMSDLLWALKEFKMPTLLISLMSLMHRYIFVFWAELRTMKIAQTSRLGYVSFERSVHSSGQLIASLFLRVYIKCDRVYDALESRGYSGDFQQLDKQYEPGRALIWSAASMVLLAALTVWLERSGLV